jgi:signal transduction histidine kinase
MSDIKLFEKAHNGEIKVETEEGKGSTFIIRFSFVRAR